MEQYGFHATKLAKVSILDHILCTSSLILVPILFYPMALCYQPQSTPRLYPYGRCHLSPRVLAH